jgi:hypothetical protein
LGFGLGDAWGAGTVGAGLAVGEACVDGGCWFGEFVWAKTRGSRTKKMQGKMTGYLFME